MCLQSLQAGIFGRRWAGDQKWGLQNIPANVQESFTFFSISFDKVCFLECLCSLITWGPQRIGGIRLSPKRDALPFLPGCNASKSRVRVSGTRGRFPLPCVSTPFQEAQCGAPLARPTSERRAPKGGEPANPRGRRALADPARPAAPGRHVGCGAPAGSARAAGAGVAEGSESRDRRRLTYFSCGRRRRTPPLRAARSLTWNRTCRSSAGGCGQVACRVGRRASGPGGAWLRLARPEPGLGLRVSQSSTQYLTDSFREVLRRPTGLPANSSNLTFMNSKMKKLLYISPLNQQFHDSEFILQMGSHFCEISPQKDNHDITVLHPIIVSANDGKRSKCPKVNMVKFMEGEITFGLCLEFSEVVKKKWTALQTLIWRGLQNTLCDLKKK